MLGLLKPIHEGIHKGWRPPPFAEAARSAAPFMDGFVAAKEAADAARGVNGASMERQWASMGRQWGVNGRQ